MLTNKKVGIILKTSTSTCKDFRSIQVHNSHNFRILKIIILQISVGVPKFKIYRRIRIGIRFPVVPALWSLSWFTVGRLLPHMQLFTRSNASTNSASSASQFERSY